jgi:RNA polymerase sigma factor (sigma-70 family)
MSFRSNDGLRSDIFATTHWSVVQLAARNDTTRAHHALSKLCEGYWYPLYAYVRRRGLSPEDAQDLTQEFFVRLLAAQSFADLAPAKGKFRAFLLASLNHFLANEWDRARAIKRGGGAVPISFEEMNPEERYRSEPVDNRTAEKIYERRWTLALLEQVLGRLRGEYEQANKTALFDKLKILLTMGKGAVPLAELAAELEMTEGAVKVAAHRLRQRYREILCEQVAQTVSTAEEVDDEIRYLFSTLSG